MASEAAAKAYKELPYRKLNGLITAKEQSQIKTCYRTTFKQVSVIEEEVLMFQDEYSLPECWTVSSPEYMEGMKNIAVVKYRDALNDLEHLVVQRLLELTKLNVSSIGE